MNALEVVDKNVEPLDTVEFAPDARINYNDDGCRLRCLYPSEADTTEFVVAVFQYAESDTVELPEGAVVLSLGEGVVVAAVPSDAYGVGGGA